MLGLPSPAGGPLLPYLTGGRHLKGVKKKRPRREPGPTQKESLET
jgi:hypothetical protein